jgi:hypothetical protein
MNAPLTNEHINLTDTSNPPTQPPPSAFVSEPTVGNRNFEYPNQSSWVLWVAEVVQELDRMSDKMEWKKCVAAWLEMEYQLGYPLGMVSHLSCCFRLL